MRRFPTTVLVCLAALALAATASAVVRFDVTGVTVNGSAPSGAPAVGDDIVIDIRLSNPTGAYVRAIGGAVFGYDASAVEFVSGSYSETAHFCTDAPCTQGLFNSAGQPLVESNSPATGSFVKFLDGLTINARRNGDGSRDPGFDGVVGGGDAQFRVQFRVIRAGGVQFEIGTSLDPVIGAEILASTIPDDSNPPRLQGVNAFVSIVPEPGTALLVGFGLAALSRAGLRR